MEEELRERIAQLEAEIASLNVLNKNMKDLIQNADDKLKNYEMLIEEIRADVMVLRNQNRY